MSKPVPKSRLNITYRTRIEGRPVKQKLPFRLLTLGDFSGGNPDKLEARPVHSILPGMNIDSFMNEMQITAPIEDDKLKAKLVGKLTGSIMGTMSKLDAKKKTATVQLSGTADVVGTKSENGLGAFSGKVSLSAEPAEVSFESTTYKIGKQTLTVKGSVAGEVTGDINTSFEFDFKDVEIPDTSFKEEASVNSDAIEVQLTLSLHSMRSFTPDSIAKQVPEIRRVMLIRRLLSEIRASFSNRSELGEVFKALLVEKDHASLKKLQTWGIETYPALQLRPSADKNTGGDDKNTGGDDKNTGGDDKNTEPKNTTKS